MTSPDQDPAAPTLAELVQRRLYELGDRNGPMSLRDAAGRSRGYISYELLRNIGRGAHSGNITDRTAQGLAFALDVPLSRVYDAARVKQPGSRWKWPERFDRLDAMERKLVESLAGALLEAREKGRREANGDS